MSTSISFDEFGDLRLDIGKSSTSYTVCSKAMARSSPAFRSMLYGGFKETRPAVGDWIVRLPEEEPDAFAIILNVVHGRTDRVPRDFTDGGKDSNNRGATLLYNVARIADKYVMISLLRPWTDQWLEPFRPHRPENRGNRWSGELATAAWLLGDEVVLAYQLDQAAITMYFRGMAYKGRGWVKDITGQEFRVGAAPEGPHELIDLEGFSEMIPDTRLRLIKALVEPYKKLYSETDKVLHFPTKDCDLFVAILDRAAGVAHPRVRFRTWSDRDVQDYKGTVDEIIGLLQEWERAALDDIRNRQPENFRVYLMLHDAFALAAQTIFTVMNTRPLIQLTAEQRACLARRRGLSGVTSEFSART